MYLLNSIFKLLDTIIRSNFLMVILFRPDSTSSYFIAPVLLKRPLVVITAFSEKRHLSKALCKRNAYGCHMAADGMLNDFDIVTRKIALSTFGNPCRKGQQNELLEAQVHHSFSCVSHITSKDYLEERRMSVSPAQGHCPSMCARDGAFKPQCKFPKRLPDHCGWVADMAPVTERGERTRL